ncbi:MAG: 16S rRNA (guanine(966)-N(2))-methyltransferase RsmD [Candidatus Omnitrophota bacterium]
MKIITGLLKNRPIISPPGIRPVSNIVRKACFDILRGEFEGKAVLDLFAGSGALGIEALSNQARKCTFVDIKRPSVLAIKDNLDRYSLGQLASVCCLDAYSFLKKINGSKRRFDIIFLDPPYYKGMLKKSLQCIMEYDILTPLGYIVGFCYFKEDLCAIDKNFSEICRRRYGQTSLLLIQKINRLQ